MIGAETGLGDHAAEDGGAPQTPQPESGKLRGWEQAHGVKIVESCTHSQAKPASAGRPGTSRPRWSIRGIPPGRRAGGGMAMDRPEKSRCIQGRLCYPLGRLMER